MSQLKDKFKAIGRDPDGFSNYYPIQTKVYPIPLGTTVSFRTYLWRFQFHGEVILTGVIEKLLYPGYFKRYDYSDCRMKYCIGNIKEIPGSSFTISESNLVNPDGYKLYYNECYRNNFFNSLNGNVRTSELCIDSNEKSKSSINFTNISGIFKR